MKNFSYVMLCFYTILLLNSCKKDPDVVPTTTANTSYQPLTKGSTWKYKSSAAPGNGEYTVTATGNTKVFNGKTYQVLTSTVATGGEVYARVDGENVYEYAEQSNSGAIIKLENLAIKPAAAINATWDDKTTITNQGLTYDVIFRKTIKQKGITRKVNNIDYKDVIAVERQTIASFGGSETVTNTELIYFAKGIGPIEQVSSTVNTSLLSATIK